MTISPVKFKKRIEKIKKSADAIINETASDSHVLYTESGENIVKKAVKNIFDRHIEPLLLEYATKGIEPDEDLYEAIQGIIDSSTHNSRLQKAYDKEAGEVFRLLCEGAAGDMSDCFERNGCIANVNVYDEIIQKPLPEGIAKVYLDDLPILEYPSMASSAATGVAAVGFGSAGFGIGGKGGAIAGAVVGSAIPVIGTMAGALIGMGAGAILGAFTGGYAAGKTVEAIGTPMRITQESISKAKDTFEKNLKEVVSRCLDKTSAFTIAAISDAFQRHIDSLRAEDFE